MPKHPKVLHWDTNGRDIVIMLKRGYRWSMQDEGDHVRGFDTNVEARAELKNGVEVCKCSDCLTGNGW